MTREYQIFSAKALHVRDTQELTVTIAAEIRPTKDQIS